MFIGSVFAIYSVEAELVGPGGPESDAGKHLSWPAERRSLDGIHDKIDFTGAMNIIRLDH